MLICIFGMRTLEPMTHELVAGSSGIGEEEVAASAPMVRALVVQRLEMIWRSCEPHINPSQEDMDLGIRQDPRYIDAGIRVVDRLTNLYGLTKPTHSMAVPDSVSSQDQRALVGEALKVLENKLGHKEQ
jgi:hypothetical protein